MLYELERIKMCELVKNIYDRWLTNAAGGNLSQKVSDEHFIMTPTLMSVYDLWKCNPENILVVDKDLNIIEGDGRLTREINMHMAMYEADPRISGIIHAHPKELMVYACLGKDLELVTEAANDMDSHLKCLSYAPATTEELANKVGAFCQKQYELQKNVPYATLINSHGIIVGASDIFLANDMLERLEIDAYVNTMIKNIK